VTLRNMGLLRLWLNPQPERGTDMLQIIKNFASDDEGATAIEYGLMAALISVVIIAALQTIGTNLTADLTSVATALR